MVRTLEIALPSEQAPQVLGAVRDIEGVVGISWQRGASQQPVGDVVTLHLTGDGMRRTLERLHQRELLEGVSLMSSEPTMLMPGSGRKPVERETHEEIWEEMASTLRKTTNVGPNYLSVMALAGAVAAIGLWTDTLHLVIGAMVIAPGFQPLLRLPLGWIAGPSELAVRGIVSILAGYAALAAGAAATALLMTVLDPAGAGTFPARQWVGYWSSLKVTGVLIALFASAAGMAIVAAGRAVLTAGVMIALALVPAMTIAGMALALGDLGLAAQGFGRWGVDAVAVVLVGGLVVLLKRRLQHNRRALG